MAWTIECTTLSTTTLGLTCRWVEWYGPSPWSTWSMSVGVWRAYCTAYPDRSHYFIDNSWAIIGQGDEIRWMSKLAATAYVDQYLVGWYFPRYRAANRDIALFRIIAM